MRPYGRIQDLTACSGRIMAISMEPQLSVREILVKTRTLLGISAVDLASAVGQASAYPGGLSGQEGGKLHLAQLNQRTAAEIFLRRATRHITGKDQDLSIVSGADAIPITTEAIHLIDALLWEQTGLSEIASK